MQHLFKLGRISLAAATLVAGTLSTPLMANEAPPTQPPEGWLWGVGIATSQDIYQGFDNRVVPIPIIGYQSKNLRVYGPFVDYTFARYHNVAFSALISPRFAGYDESDSKVFAGMDDRDMSLDLGVGMRFNVDKLNFHVKALVDTLGKSEGYELEARMSRRWRFGPLVVEPSVAINYRDENYVDYYYGVESHEATSTRAYYEGEDSINYELGIGVSMPALGGMTRLGLAHNWYGDGMANSPLTDSDTAWSAMFSYTRMF